MNLVNNLVKSYTELEKYKKLAPPESIEEIDQKQDNIIKDIKEQSEKIKLFQDLIDDVSKKEKKDE